MAALPYDLSNMQAQASKLESSKSWTSEPGKIVHLKVDKRFSIVFQKFSSWPLMLDRDEQLSDLGVHGAELDSQQFADNLVQAIADHMSVRNLRHLSESIQNELKRVLEERALKN